MLKSIFLASSLNLALAGSFTYKLNGEDWAHIHDSELCGYGSEQSPIDFTDGKTSYGSVKLEIVDNSY